MTFNTALFGRIRGKSGEEWVAPTTEADAGN
jgi:hypothetical protein